MAAFEEVGVMPELIKAVEELGWMLPTPVQAECVPLILGGGDVMAAAETGSGKTGAFALPVLQIVHETLRDKSMAVTGGGNVADVQQIECILNVADKDPILSISSDGLQCHCLADKSWAGCRATTGVFSGRVYYEVTLCDDGLCRVGWSTLSATLQLGMDNFGFGYGSTGKISNGKNFDTYGEPFEKGDTIGCFLDLDTLKIHYSKNGIMFPVAFNLSPRMQGNTFYPAVLVKGAQVQLNFGDSPFNFRLPPNYVGISKAPINSISNPRISILRGDSREIRNPLCLILEPSRDLAEQTHVCIDSFKKYLTAPTISNELFVGGVDPKSQLRAVRDGIDIITGTPGRIIDFIQSGKISISQVKFFVLDEADRLLDTGNQNTILDLYSRFPKNLGGTERLQVLMFSATLHSDEVKQLAKQICQNPIIVDLKGKDAVPEAVDHVLVRIDPEEDRSWLQSQPKIGPNVKTKECYSEAVKILKQRMLHKIIDAFKMDQCMIFCRTNYDCDNLEKFLNELGGGRAFRGKAESGKENPYSCIVLAGGRSMEERKTALKVFKEGDVRFLICTDVAARGIDIKELPYVVNMTLPDKSEDYVHRVGRVGRADTMGLAISLIATVPEKVWYCSIKGYKPWLQPDDQNTKTNDKGGQTIWYDELMLLKEIEARLGGSIQPLNYDLSLPESIRSRGSQYGQQRGDAGVSKEAREHLEQIRQNVEELARLEWEAQTSFLKLSEKFKRQKDWPALGSK